MTDNKIYTTSDGDMWDSIAHRVMGDCMYSGQLMEANPRHLGTYLFPAGVELVIPVIVHEEADSNLPPWKRRKR